MTTQIYVYLVIANLWFIASMLSHNSTDRMICILVGVINVGLMAFLTFYA